MLLAGVLLLAIAALDASALVRSNLAQFYFAPIALTAWCVSQRASAVVAALAAAFVFSHGIQDGYRDTGALPSYVVKLATLAIFVAAGILVARLRREQAHLAAFARRDQLTGIANRMALMERLTLELARHRRTAQSFALAFIDCDNFKEINDKHGHLAGDRCLQVIAVALREAMRSTDLVCRLSGDEFVVFLPDTAASGARRVADTLESRLREETLNAGWRMTFSIGVAVFPTPPADPEAAIQRADHLMYAAKQSGKGRSTLEVIQA
ncbi:MAG: GGDEF domain-containing protein [Propionivibrio sp.]